MRERVHATLVVPVNTTGELVDAGSADFFFQAEDGIRDWPRDWSSDVCSSDLAMVAGGFYFRARSIGWHHDRGSSAQVRSEERRVGKECRVLGAPEPQQKKCRIVRSVVFAFVLHSVDGSCAMP